MSDLGTKSLEETRSAGVTAGQAIRRAFGNKSKPAKGLNQDQMNGNATHNEAFLRQEHGIEIPIRLTHIRLF